MFQKILLATGGSDHSLRAAEKAIELATYNDNALVTVLYVVSELNDELMQEHHQKMKSTHYKAEQAGIQHELIIIQGDPGPAIVDHAHKSDMDIVIIGSRGLNKLQEMVLGSVSKHVAKRAKCPVMIVK